MRPAAAPLAALLPWAVAAAAAAAELAADLEAEAPCAADSCDAIELGEAAAPLGTVSLLQTRLQRGRAPLRAAASASAATTNETHDLVFMHIPFNFGHTIEKVAAFGAGSATLGAFMARLHEYGSWSGQEDPTSTRKAKQLPPVPGVAWAHLHPLLQDVSNVTGCPMYYTPQKYWPQDLAEKYFGDGRVFGLLRDPYERLVAGFRGNQEKYGASDLSLFASCDVNLAVKKAMKKYIAGGSEFAKGCSLVPQAEYFDGPYGITVPVDNRQFPSSMNKVFKENGHPEMRVLTEDIFHVHGCSEVWAADLDNETRALVKQVYRRDFELLCEHFGYCNDEENTCIWQVPEMCPTRVLASGYRGHA